MSEDNMHTENLVRVAVDSHGRNFLDRKDAQVASLGTYDKLVFADLVAAKDRAHASVNRLDPSNPVSAIAEKNLQESLREIKDRETEANKLGLNAPISATLTPLQRRLEVIEQNILQGNMDLPDAQRFIRDLSLLDLKRLRLPAVPTIEQDRLGGIQEYVWNSRLGQLRGRAQGIIDKLSPQPQNPTQSAQPNIGPQPQGISGDPGIQQLIDIQQQQLEFQRREYEMSIKGYDQFIQLEKNRQAALTPDTFGASGALTWLRGRTEQEQRAINARVAINYLAATKAAVGMEDMETWSKAKARVEREGVQNMWLTQPGFRQVMATMMYDLFEMKDYHLVISDHGYTILGKQGGLEEYKNQLTGSVMTYLENKYGGPTKDVSALEKHQGVRLQDIATAAVSSVDNILYAFAVYDSADEKRKVQDGSVYSEQPRTLCMPGIKGRGKWAKGERASSPQGTDEGWGGKLGEWVRQRSVRSRRFRNDVKDGKTQYIPDRMLFGGFDHLLYDRKDKDITLAMTLRPDDRAFREDPSGLVDYVDAAASQVDFSKLQAANLYEGWTNIRDKAIKVYNHLTGDPKTKVFTADNSDPLFDALRDLINDKVLGRSYKSSWDLLTACYFRAAGFNPNEYVDELIPADLNQGTFDKYDEAVQMLLEDERVPKAWAGGEIASTGETIKVKQALFNLLNANPPGLKIMDVPVVGQRSKLKTQAMREKWRVQFPIPIIGKI